MTKLEWDSTEAKNRLGSGVSHGVLYPKFGPGVVWNGLVNVAEEPISGEVVSLYLDGVRYRNNPPAAEYQSTISAYSAPHEFARALGEHEPKPGIYLTNQEREGFNLSYRTLVGENDYKIHLIYNAVVTPSSRGYETLSDQSTPSIFEWKIDAVPVRRMGLRPSAHYTLDSTDLPLEILQAVEGYLYGTETLEPRMLSVEDLVDFIKFWDPKKVVPNEVTGLAAIAAGPPEDLTNTQKSGIFRTVPGTRLIETATSGFYGLED